MSAIYRQRYVEIKAKRDLNLHHPTTFNEDCGKIRSDVAGDAQGMPGVDGPIGEDYPGGVDVVATIVLISLCHRLCQCLSTHIVQVCTLLDVVPGHKHKKNDSWKVLLMVFFYVISP